MQNSEYNSPFIPLFKGIITQMYSFVNICIQYFLKRFILDLLENNKISSTWNRIYEIILMPVMSFEVLKELIFNKEKK